MEVKDNEKEGEFDIESNSDSNSDISVVDIGEDTECTEETKEEVSEIYDWAYSVMDWLVCAVESRAWSEIMKHMDDIITAFVVLVKDEHKGIVIDTLRKISEVLGG